MLSTDPSKNSYAKKYSIEKELKTINNKIYNCTKKSIDNMCGFCNKNYYNKSNLRRHINEHCDIRKDLIEKRTKLTDMKKNNNNKIKKITNQLTSILQVH